MIARAAMLKAWNRTNFIIIDPLVVGAGSMADRWRTLKPGVGMRDMKANLNFSSLRLLSALINGLGGPLLGKTRKHLLATALLILTLTDSLRPTDSITSMAIASSI